jgi:hypothetical protein
MLGRLLLSSLVLLGALGAVCSDLPTTLFERSSPLQIVVQPPVDTLWIGDTIHLTAMVGNRAVGGFSWTSLSEGAATVDSLGTVRAVAAGSALIVAAAVAQGAVVMADTATVVVQVATLTRLILTPDSITLAPGGIAQFAVAGSWSDGSATVPAVTYSATGGTITAGGRYTADTKPAAYRVAAIQQGGRTADTSTVTVVAPPRSDCVRTLNTTTVSGLTVLLSRAEPGDCILLAAGTYEITDGSPHTTVGLSIARSGTAAAPIVIQGRGSSTIIDLNQRLMFVDASYIHLRRMRLTDFPGMGVWLRGVTGVVLDSVEVDHTLQEAVALHYGSHHNIIKNSWFHDTGILNPQYGEGIYVGGRAPNGPAIDYGVTDNQVLNSRFGPNVRAEGVGVKEGADRTIIRGNFFDGSGTVYVGGGATTSLIEVVASGVVIDSNLMQYGNPMGVTFVRPSTGTMSGNIATRNTIDLQDIHQAERGTLVPYGFQFQSGTTDPMGAVVSCNNIMVSGLLSNRPCTP